MKKFLYNIIKKKSEDFSEVLQDKYEKTSKFVCEKTEEILSKIPEFKFEEVPDEPESPIISEDNNLDTVTIKRSTFSEYARVCYQATMVEQYLDKFGVSHYPKDNQTRKPFNLLGRVVELARMARDGEINDELKDFIDYH